MTETDPIAAVPASLRAQVVAWLADELAIGSRTFPSGPGEGGTESAGGAELRVLLERAESVDPADAKAAESALAELTDRFRGPLSFGTAGLRGPMRAGPNGMNTIVVRKAAAGLAAYLRQQGRAGQIVVIGYDGRHRSESFARDSAAILSAAGFQARLLPRMLPTPVLAYAVRELRAAAGVMVTASHNPSQDNGYKVYAADGAQIIPPMDREIEAHIRAVTSVADIALDESAAGQAQVPESLVQGYVTAVAALVDPATSRDITVVHTALHGVGAPVLRAVFQIAGFPAPLEVPEQAVADPDFPTVAYPNPEEPGAMDLALALAERTHADLLIANDPDADRCAVGVPFPGPGGPAWRMLSGDDVGILLADRLLSRGVTGTYATTIVSSTMLGEMAERHGVGFAETLTGFKWIARAAPDLAYGYEEALGYAVAPQLVRDKDGISAALLIAEHAAWLKAGGSSLPRRLAELFAQYGWHATKQLSWRFSDLSRIAEAMRRAREYPPAMLLGRAVTVCDLAPDADVLIFRFDGGRAVVRPSGTEPKCKAYLEWVSPTGSAEEAGRALAELGAEITRALGY